MFAIFCIAVCLFTTNLFSQSIGTTKTVNACNLQLRCGNCGSEKGQSSYEAPEGWGILSYKIQHITPKLGDTNLTVETVQGPSMEMLTETLDVQYNGLLKLMANVSNIKIKAFEISARNEYKNMKNLLRKSYNTHSKIMLIGSASGRPLRSGGNLDVQAQIVLVKLLSSYEIERRIQVLCDQLAKISK